MDSPSKPYKLVKFKMQPKRNKHSIVLWIIIWFLVVDCFLIAERCGAEKSPGSESPAHERTLAAQGIRPTAEGIAEYLHQLHPTPPQQQATRARVAQLGSDHFSARERAMRQLLIMPGLDTKALVKALEHGDPEVRWRAREVLAVRLAEKERLLHASFKTLEMRSLPGVVPEVLAAIGLCETRDMRWAARTALVATARAGDADDLRSALESESPHVRAAATAALGEALGRDGETHLQKMATDKNAQVRFAAAHAMANYGHRRALEVLIALLEDEDILVRNQSLMVLRRLSQRSFGFGPDDTPDRRRRAVQKWRVWAASEGQIAKLHFPLKLSGPVASYLAGHTLLAFGAEGKVVETDASGREIWSFPTKPYAARSAEKMANGNVLITAILKGKHERSTVLEVNRQGKVVWQYRSPTLLGQARPLPNGNILISTFYDRTAMEVNWDYKVVWSYRGETLHCLSDAQRLENGNTLIADFGGPIQEITPQGKVVWQYDDYERVLGVQLLPGGNLLIAGNGGEVREINRNKQVIWTYSGEDAKNTSDAFRLPNGNTLITSLDQFLEVTPDGEKVWCKKAPSIGGGFVSGTARR